MTSVLEQLDAQKFSSYHVMAILVAGTGFLTDAYDLFVINLVVQMIALAYFPSGSLSHSQDSVLKTSAGVGTLLGQLVFGYLSDKLGRKKMYGVELLLIMIGTVNCAFASSTIRGIDIIGMLSIWRFILGFGIGGDYPVSAVITICQCPWKRIYDGKRLCHARCWHLASLNRVTCNPSMLCNCHPV